MITQKFTADAEATYETEDQRGFYAGVLRDSEWRPVASCLHHHRTREAADKCAEKILADFERGQ